MKLVSWNVNGLRACLDKGFMEAFQTLDADIFCIQETKLQHHAGQLTMNLPDYYQYWNSAEKKGYSGVAVFTKREPLSVRYGMGVPEHDKEGRLITVEFEDFYLVCCYTPNSQSGLKRLDYRLRWELAFRAYLTLLGNEKPTILCGDLNVAHRPIDLKNPSGNHHNAGFTDEERHELDELFCFNFIDTYRFFHPDQSDAYTWWSYRTRARERNAGWRIDYFIVTPSLKKRLVSADIHPEIYGSDHCPVELVLLDEEPVQA